MAIFKVAYKDGSKWVINENKFQTLNDACKTAARIFASVDCNLPVDLKYHLEWEIVCRDEQYTRVWQSKDGYYRVIAEEY